MKTRLLIAAVMFLLYHSAGAQNINMVVTDYDYHDGWMSTFDEKHGSMLVNVYADYPKKIKSIRIEFHDIVTGDSLRSIVEYGPIKYGKDMVSIRMNTLAVATKTIPREIDVHMFVNEVMVHKTRIEYTPVGYYDKGAGNRMVILWDDESSSEN